MNYITYAEAASIHNVSILTICKAVQDFGIPIKGDGRTIFLDADELDKHKIIPPKEQSTQRQNP